MTTSISNDVELEDLKREFPTPIERRLSRLRKKGRYRWEAICPFHDDHTPSWSMGLKGGIYLWKCFGCDRSGSVIDFVERFDHCSLAEAIATVKKEMGSSGRRLWVPPQHAQEPPKKEFSFTDERLQVYEGELESDLFDEAKPFLEQRGIQDEVAKQLRLGLALRYKFDCHKPGCTKCGTYPALVIPRFRNGKLVGVKYRNLTPPDNEHKWSQETGSCSDFIYLADEEPVDPSSKVCALLEGELDTALVRSFGFNAVGIFGTSGAPNNPCERFLESVEMVKAKYDHILLIGDSDDPGRQALQRFYDCYTAEGTIFLKVPRPYKDISEFFAAEGKEQVTNWLSGWCAAAPTMSSVLRAEIKTKPATPKLSDVALYGLAGDIVRKLIPETEAHPAALQLEVLIRFGNVIGRTAHYKVEDTRHFGNLFAVKCGATSKSRKGTSAGRIEPIFAIVDAAWAANRLFSGLGSGEGVIDKVRDEVLDEAGKVESPGIRDQRMFVYEGELASALAVMKRDGNTLSPVIRNAWDGKKLQITTRNTPATSSNAHISLLGDITREELHLTLAMADKYNGFANRFLWLHVERCGLKPFGGNDIDWAPEIARLKDAVSFARRQGRIYMDRNAREMWERAYEKLSVGQPGIFGAVTSRSEAQVIRLALLHALLDCKDKICAEHLKAALAFWQYCEDSARYIFGGLTPEQQQLLQFLGEGWRSKSQIYRDCFSGHRKSEQINADLKALMEAGKVITTSKEDREVFKCAV
jgi:hypothetical protein